MYTVSYNCNQCRKVKQQGGHQDKEVTTLANMGENEMSASCIVVAV